MQWNNWLTAYAVGSVLSYLPMFVWMRMLPPKQSIFIDALLAVPMALAWPIILVAKIFLR